MFMCMFYVLLLFFIDVESDSIVIIFVTERETVERVKLHIFHAIVSRKDSWVFFVCVCVCVCVCNQN